MLVEYVRYSLKNLRSRRLRSWLTLIGIFIGIAAVVSLVSLGEGLRFAIMSQFGFLGPELITVNAGSGLGPPGTTKVVNPLTESNIKSIEKVNGVKMAVGRVADQIKIEYNKKAEFSMAASMPDGEARKEVEEIMGFSAEKGRLLRDGDKYAVVIGSALAEEKSFGKEILPGTKIKVEGREVEVVGVLKKKGNFILDGAVLMDEEAQREIMDDNTRNYDVIAVRAKKGTDVAKLREDIEKLLRKERDVREGEEDFSVESAQQIVESMNSILLGVSIFVWVIAGISLIVGGIGIMNTMYTAVIERTREIGVMKAVGARNSSIFMLFLIESGIIGSIGGIAGIIGGVMAASSVAAIGRAVLGSELIRTHSSMLLIIGAFLFSFALGSAFGAMPAYWAAKLQPVDSLRHAR